MKFISKYIAVVLLAGFFTTNQSIAQQTAVPTYADINYIRKSNAWLQAQNAAGLKHFNTSNISDASLFFNKENGGFRNYFQSNDSQTYGLQAESFTRLNQKVVLSGGFGYQNFKGKNMSGSAFIDPYKSSFDIVELDASNKGTKELELYNLNGGLSVQLNSDFSIGAKLNYQAANYAKRKDLRHVNKLLDLDGTVGVLYKINTTVELGANYHYSRRIESLNFRTFGNTDKQYLSLISFGTFYGQSELFGQYGFTSSQQTIPLKNIQHGAALQLNVNFNDKISLFNEFGYDDRNGFYGEEGTSSTLLTRHNGSIFTYNGLLAIKNAKVEHHIALSGFYNYLNNRKTIYTRTTSTGGVNTIVYYGDNSIFVGETLNAALTYDWYLDVKDNQPSWAINVTADYMARNNSTGFYPFYRDQNIKSYQLSAMVSKQLQRQKDAFNIGLGLGYGSGNGNLVVDGTMVTPSADHTPPTSMPQFLNEEYEFFTASRIKTNVAFKYTKVLPNNKMGAYLKLNYGYIFAPNAAYLGKHFNTASISLGSSF